MEYVLGWQQWFVEKETEFTLIKLINVVIQIMMILVIIVGVAIKKEYVLGWKSGN